MKMLVLMLSQLWFPTLSVIQNNKLTMTLKLISLTYQHAHSHTPTHTHAPYTRE